MNKKKTMMFLVAMIVLFIVAFRPKKGYEVQRSTVVSSGNHTEVWLSVVLNDWYPIDREKMIKEIAGRQPPIGDGSRQVYFRIELYRTDFHYRHGWKYDTVLCDQCGEVTH